MLDHRYDSVMTPLNNDWYRLADESSIATPALLFYPERIDENIARAIRIAGRVDRLRPHVKTHKSPHVTAMMLRRGITRFKCATLGEARMLADAGASDVVVAYPLVGPNVGLFVSLIEKYTDTVFRALVETPEAVDALESAASRAGCRVEVLVDLNVGMNRTGIEPGEHAVALYRRIAEASHLVPAGLHAYDGHIRESDFARRREMTRPIVGAIYAMIETICEGELEVPRVIAGGTPTFPCHAEVPDFELSPGTLFLHDWGYLESFPDLDFLPAALILGRVVSIPAPGLFTVDIGSKAIASDPAGARGLILNVPGAEPVGQSEEHWVFRWDPDAADGAKAPKPGDPVYVLPRHICPSVDRHPVAHVVDGTGTVVAEWPITARERRLTGLEATTA
ncbi:MAG: D-TA family PLP-dependent enzyme [Spirochaetaceae bacterium]|nr:MAG: D-TA family PLP-dependent enzyme [Spirochaetaceae bacterium]